MLTVSHIVTLLTVGTLVSGGIMLVTEYFAQEYTRPGGKKTAAEKGFRRWVPVFAGLFFGSWGFPATFAIVVGPILPFDAWWEPLAWLAGGLFAGLCAGAGSRVARDIGGRLIQGRVE